MKQTAVEWLKFQISSIEFQDPAAEELYLEIQPLIEQAKAMEKEQSEKMYEYAAWAMFYNGHGETFEEYWNKNFKSA